MEQAARVRLKINTEKLKKCLEEYKTMESQNQVFLQDLQRLKLTFKMYIAKNENLSETIHDATELEGNLELQGQAEEALLHIESKLEVLSIENRENRSTNLKLPKLELPKFDGNILKFSDFWKRFESVTKQNIPDQEKYAYLLGCLEGKARDLLSGYESTESGYQLAIETLLKQYGNSENIVEAHYNAIDEIKTCSESTLECRNNLNTIQKHVRILKQKGENTEGKHIYTRIIKKFPTRLIYDTLLLKGENCTATELLDGLTHIISIKEKTNHDKDCVATTQALNTVAITGVVADKKQPNKRKILDGSDRQAKIIKKTCAFCDENSHYSDQCRHDLQYRRQVIKDKKLCFKCLGRNHRIQHCPMKYELKCWYCGEKHNRALCPSRGKTDNEQVRNINYKRTESHRNGKFLKGKKRLLAIENGNRNKDGKQIKSTCNTLVAKSRDGKDYIHHTYLQTASATVEAMGRSSPCRVLMDSGSQRSYITKDIAKKLQISSQGENQLMIYTFGSDKPTETNAPISSITVRTKRGLCERIMVYIVPFITTDVYHPTISMKSHYLVDIMAEDNPSYAKIDVLIGIDYYHTFILGEQIKLQDHLYLINSKFGWITSGSAMLEYDKVTTLSVATYYRGADPETAYFTEPDLPLRSIDIRFLWNLESIGISDSPKTTRQDQAITHFIETVQVRDNRYYVKWPWTQYPPELPTNYGIAFGRLKGLLSRSDEETLKEYMEILDNQKRQGIIEEVECTQNPFTQMTPPIHYLPHHIVKQVGKKGRIVYDASAKLKDQKSLNETLYSGPSMLEDLTSLLLKFRTHNIGISSDIEKAFLQIGLQEDDRNVTRFLWVKDIKLPASEDNLIHLRFCRVPFGIISSPFLLTATITHHMARQKKDVLKNVTKQMYVDNLITGTNSVQEAIHLYDDVKSSFNEMSMNLRDWTSNSEEFISHVPEDMRGNTEGFKLLGLNWNLFTDKLSLRYKEENSGTITKRSILRTIARVYDPCGFVSPIVLPAKLLFQDLCKQKLKWDTVITGESTGKWNTIRQEIKAVERIEVPRFMTISSDIVEYQLHSFTDASMVAYAAAVYLRTETKDDIKSMLVMSKSRIKPLEEKENLKIPKLELLGCLIGSRLLTYVNNSLNLPNASLYLWSDSKIVLSWLRSNKLLPPFVARRVEEIKKAKGVQPLYINTSQNPADLATRPNIWSKNKTLWFEGPEFLKWDASKWPTSRFISYQSLVVREAQDFDNPVPTVIKHPAPQIQKSTIPVTEEDKSIDRIEIKKLQQEHYPKESNRIVTPLAKNLGLFIDVEGILRCKGRFTNTNWNYDKRYPILLPRSCTFTNKLIQEVHSKNYHVGTNHTLSIIREKFWIPKGRMQVKTVLQRCSTCKKHIGGPYRLPESPSLPLERVNYSTAYTYCGLDYLGPLYVINKSQNDKRWICLFTCMAVRAIHLEVVNDLSAEECVNAIKRFTATRGTPQLIVSDNATQFKLTAELMNRPYCVQNQIQWKFIPQLAPWHGGFYERLVSLVKHCLKRTLDKHKLNDSQLSTVTKEVESVLNSRPLTNVGSEPGHILKPNDFLNLKDCLVPQITLEQMSADVTETKRNLIEAWKRGQILVDEFKNMFVNQYLTSLRERSAIAKENPRVLSSREPKLGDTVQIKGDSKNRLDWKVGKISELITGSDGKIRVAKILVGGRSFTRSIGHLYPLEIDEVVLTPDQSAETTNHLGSPSDRNSDALNDMGTLIKPCPNVVYPDVNSKLSFSNTNDNPETETVNQTPENANSADSCEPSGSEIVEPFQTESVVIPPTESITVPDETDRDPVCLPESRPRRAAAEQAAARIREWTRQLATLL